MKTTNYDKQANDFLKKTKTKIKIEFLRHGKHFLDDQESRDIYKITLKRGSREWTFEFGNSIFHSGKFFLWTATGKKITNDEKERHREIRRGSHTERNENYKEPSAYDILASITKWDAGTFSDFCREFGYYIDSKEAEKLYHAVLLEWNNVKMLWTDKEIEQLRKIQ